MARDWEAAFESWAQPPSQTELEKCENAVRAIRKAVDAHSTLSLKDIAVFAQGSYRNRTNVRADSDVDVCVCCRNSIFFDLPDGMQSADVGISTPADYSYSSFKNDVHVALASYFGSSAVKRGNKAFDIHENTYRVSADTVACFEYRRYNRNGSHLVGTSFLPDSGGRIINWPDQNYENGVAKNDRTGRCFKALVRILKRLKGEMEEGGYGSARDVPSYLVECLVWNVPDDGFGHSTRRADLRYALAHLFNETRDDESCKEWGEINELKYLFRSSQPWTRQSANRFLHEAWNYVGFE
ncbi:MAG: nucleotidyltransferase [Chloroflexi bacterium]|nr:nucleotidyltransferase [Chloroflexota bacterium]